MRRQSLSSPSHLQPPSCPNGSHSPRRIASPNRRLPSPRNRLLSIADTSICDGMSNCHLAESWASVFNHQSNVPIAQMRDLPILNPYVPLRYPLNVELQTPTNGYFIGTLDQNVPALGKASLKPLESETSQQDFPNFKCPPSDFSLPSFARHRTTTQPTPPHPKATADYRNKSSIKFQDRNKKVDFKVNFRDENRKVDGCFYNEENRLLEGSASVPIVLPPPKKKWIRNYMTGKLFK